ncbi:hypothetical protein [Aminipila terrae]|uniref:Acetylglutamate kinase n=1 Tax=Aminipila terrae TaxID=2697030 RepID=A0A6P1MKC8_9FIRM|nr:hypothetical protein [Aminipila terrae]QHI73603.1 hypothetical protein Ami3637_15570 [Aminipila terrae]
MRSVKIFQDSCIPSSQMNLIFESRIIWRDLANWIRAYLVSVYAGFGNKTAVEEKIKSILLKNTNIISLIFGEQSAEQYIGLITEFISTLKSLIDAQINGDADAVNEYTNKLYENADKRAAFASSINPFWVESEWKNFLYQFVQLTIDQSATFLNKEYTKNIEIYDRILNLTNKMGDYYSQGLINYLTYSK